MHSGHGQGLQNHQATLKLKAESILLMLLGLLKQQGSSSSLDYKMVDKAVGSAYGHLTVIVVFHFLGYMSLSEILACILSCSAPSPLAEQRCCKLELPRRIAKGFYYSKNQNL